MFKGNWGNGKIIGLLNIKKTLHALDRFAVKIHTPDE